MKMSKAAELPWRAYRGTISILMLLSRDLQLLHALINVILASVRTHQLRISEHLYEMRVEFRFASSPIYHLQSPATSDRTEGFP